MNLRVRDFLPSFALKVVGSMIVKRRVAHLVHLSPDDAFDEIYRKKMWKQGKSLSGLGSEGKWAKTYCELVSQYIVQHGCKTVLDLGCGDFSVGRMLIDVVEKYIGGDISKTIIEANKKEFGHVRNVQFLVLDAMTDSLPECDLILVRQVFQHLTNQQIELALRNIERTHAGHVLVTEHTYRPELLESPNIDLVSHSIRTRVTQKSGVDIGQPPFSRPRRVLATLEPGPENGAEPDSVLCVYEMRINMCDTDIS